MLYYSSLKFYFVILLNVNFLNSFSWDFGDESTRIHAVCTLKCDFNLAINGDEFYCDQSCQDHMCREGCGFYEDAITLTCSDLCTDYVHQVLAIFFGCTARFVLDLVGNPEDRFSLDVAHQLSALSGHLSYQILNISEAQSDIRITQVPKQSCTQGCSFGLDEYFSELTQDLEGVLLPPVPVLENIGHDHVELSWEYEPLFNNLTFFLQKKVLDTNTDWQVHTSTTRLSSGNFLVEDLHPYITYQFKVIFEFTSVHSVETQYSANITTRSHGVPSSSPLVTGISTPSTTVISVSWEPPIFTNGPLVAYRLTVRPIDSSKREVQNDVSPDVHAWIFGQLHSGQRYEVFVSAVNKAGEGPAHGRNVTTPAAGNLSDHETPYLILGADNMVVKLRLLELAHRDAEPVLTKPKSILVTGVGVHIDKQLVLVADDSGVVTLTSISGDQQADDIYPMLGQPTAIDIDWLHNLAYVVDRYRVVRCSIQWMGNHCDKILDLHPDYVREIKVDPINGFLYFTTYDTKGLFRKDLAHFGDLHSKLSPLIDSDLHTFVLDYESFLLYIPNNPQNTIMSAYLDGTGLTDVRRGTVVRPYFINIASMVLYDGKFFWTNGSVLYSEEYDKNRTYYHNALALLEKNFCGFNLFYPSAQPVPIPTNPPANVQVLFTATKAIIQWDVPEKLQFQGDGVYKNWLYEVNILQDDGSHNSLHQTERQLELVVMNLEPDTQYKVKVRAKSPAGTGPWSEVFNGRTLKEELDSVELLVAVRHQYKMWEIKQYSIDGEEEKMLVETSPLSPGVTDLAWFQDLIFWTSEDGELFMYDDETTKVLDFVSDASCVSVDWLGEKLYWSVYKNGVIKRSDIYGQSVEFVYQALARDMAIDSIQGRIYWVTINSLETANLNGDNALTYFSVPYFSGNYVISLTLDLDLHKVFWYLKGFENEDLYMADMIGYRNSEVVESVRLVANFHNVAKFSPLKHFSSHLVWLDDNESVTVGDTRCNYSSSLSRIGAEVTMFNIRHPSLQPFPGKLDSSTVCVIPREIPPGSIQATGSWSHFNVTWQPSVEVNHGEVSYEVSVEAEYMMKNILITKDSWYDIRGLPPYSLVTVTVRGYTYWGLGTMTKTTIRSPMSVPEAAQSPKVYVTQRKNAASSKVTLAADFRWSEPESTNGILSSQNVFYWKSSEPHKVSSMALPASARHFILDDLQGNTTYFFQVEACTEVGCGPKSVVANATADAVNPVPKLLIATESGVLLAEADNIVNTSVPMTTKSAVTMVYLAQEEVLYWVNRDMYLEEFHQGKNKKLFKLEGTASDLAIDWISRTIFFAENRDNEGHIRSYEIDRQQQNTVILRDGKMIGNVILDPYTSSIIWSEKDSGSQAWLMYRSHITGSNVTRFFANSSRKKRAVNVPCSCHGNQNSASVLAMDLSQDGHTEVIFVDEDNNIVASDVYGCHCRTLLTTSPQDLKGLPPDLLTVDHVHIYWYNAVQSRLYLLDKESGKLLSRPLTDIKDIYPYGAHLQPLPASQCLDTSPYTDSVDIVSVTNTSVIVRLHPVTWPDACENISQPSLRYTVFYRKHDERSSSDQCGPSGQWCDTKESYNREITIDGLDPYTSYTLQGAVSNYYSRYSATSLGDPSRITTKPGVPSAVGNITANAQSPNSIGVMWPPPINPNGPVHNIEYYVRWSTTTTKGTSNSMMTGAIKYEDMDPHNSEQFSWTLQNLRPSHFYRIQIICNQTEGNFVQESLPVFVMTFEEPDNITLIDRTNTTMSVAWLSPSDNSVHMFSIYYAMVHDGPLDYVNQDLPELTTNSTLYNTTLSNLQPDTEYSFRLNIMYRSFSYRIYHWPKDGTNTKYIFRTLTGIPGYPEPPVIEEITSGEFELSWVPPHDFGENITYYLVQYRHIDKENWSFAVNTTDTRWVLDDGTLPRGFTYVFRVKAQNKNGWGPYSLNSSMFSYPILQAKSDDTVMTVVAVVCAIGVVLLAMVIIAICITVCKRRNDKRKKKHDFIAVARGPDLELATLRELPTSVIHQNNTLYAINMVPTDDDIAALPHFRRDQLVLCKFLGSGAFGEVFEGLAKNIINETSGDTKVAVKTLRKSASDQEKEEFLKEALLMSNFRHAHILSLLGVCLDNDPQFIILELMEGGDLLSFMRACRLSSIQNRSELSLTDLVKICVHVARGCKYLEDMHFVHRDLAARNCLVSSCNPSEMVVKIGDFGLARDIYKNDYYRKEGEGLLPVRWMSPESLIDGVFTTQSDIWAFGVLMWEVVTFGQQPYPARTNIEVLHFVRTGGRLDRPDNCPEDFYQLMCKCWSFASEDRPSFAYLLQQLEQFQETCASISEYLVPIRSSNQPIAAVGGLNYLTGRRERLRSTSSDGPEYYHITHTPYGSHRMYGSIRRATSFDAPEPKDATQQIVTDSSNYLEPKSCGRAQYIEFLPDSQTQNYMYNLEGERVLENNEIERRDSTSLKVPLYVQTMVKENETYNTTDNVKYLNQKRVTSPTPYRYINKNADRENDSVYDIVMAQTADSDKLSCRDTDTGLTNHRRGSSVSTNQNAQISPEDVKYATIKYSRPRKQRLDSGTSMKSFDSVQTEPAYYIEPQTYRSILNSSSSSRSNYSMSHIPEHAPVHSEYYVTDGNDEEKYWANNNSNVTYAKVISPIDTRGPVDYLNKSLRSPVYPESAGVLAGYDIVQSSLV